jgi:hypothetical protein
VQPRPGRLIENGSAFSVLPTSTTDCRACSGVTVFSRAHVRAIATKWLNWQTLAPLAAKYQALIAADVKLDTRKLDTFEAFETSVSDLRTFAEKRRALLLATPAR